LALVAMGANTGEEAGQKSEEVIARHASEPGKATLVGDRPERRKR
jgi:hypothetical protein